MRGLLRSRLAGLWRRVGALLSVLLFQRPDTAPPALRGKMRRAVVVPSPDPRFSEAVFLLSEDILRGGGVSRSDLLEQAKAAAESAAAEALPTVRRRLRPGLVFLLGVLAALLGLYLRSLL